MPHRRQFLQLAGASAALGACAAVCRGDASANQPLKIGQAEVDITPPKGIELAGFHKRPGNERKITHARHSSAAHVLVLQVGEQTVALVSLDIIFISREFAAGVQRRVAEQVGIPAGNVHVCCTHTHSMPTFTFLRQWGAVPTEYEQQVADKIVLAVRQAKDDLTAGEMYLGKARVVGGNFNRTTSTWKTDAQFDAQSTEADRWLDTMLHVLRFERSGKPDVLWYHFSCHPVCYTDTESGPDWVGHVGDYVRGKYGVSPGFLQGHAGDVNPGNGHPWIGEPAQTSVAIILGFEAALSAAKRVPVSAISTTQTELQLPLDLKRFQQEIETFRANREMFRAHPEKCGGVWVDAGFAEDWFTWAEKYDAANQIRTTPLSALRIGELGMVIHSSELYSYYGLAIRRDSPFENTLVVGYSDDCVGYLPDSKAYDAQEYAAVVVPMIVNLPPFTPQAAAHLKAEASKLLSRLA